jgi:peptidoglycan/xylan/chitin deacetylase (PgdA/CDA1 family)
MMTIRSRRSVFVAASLLFGLCFLAGTGLILLARTLSAAPPGGIPIGTGPDGGVPGAPGGDTGNGGDVAPPTYPEEQYAIYPRQTIVLPSLPGTGGPGSETKIPDPPRVVTGISPGSRRVALTFDAGWEWVPVPSLLEVLEGYGLKVTFFPRGKWIEDHPDLVRAILAAGHEIGNHSYTHPNNMPDLSLAEVEAEIRLAKEALLRVAGSQAIRPLYRPPYGTQTPAAAQALAKYGYGWSVMWQADSIDWSEDSGTDEIVNNVLSKVKDGGIVLMHVGRIQTVEALPRIIEGLRARGYEIVGVSKLLGIAGAGQTQPQQRTHTVMAGETLYGIARQYGTSVEVLLQLNPQIGK